MYPKARADEVLDPSYIRKDCRSKNPYPSLQPIALVHPQPHIWPHKPGHIFFLFPSSIRIESLAEVILAKAERTSQLARVTPRKDGRDIPLSVVSIHVSVSVGVQLTFHHC